MDKSVIDAQAEAYWERHVAPVMRRLVIDAVRHGAAISPAAFADWLAATPAGLADGAEPVAPAPDPPSEASLGQDGVAAHEAAGAQGRASATPQPEAVADATRRPLQGLSKATYDIVERTGKPMTSRELLNALREREGGKKSPERDNTLLAAMRRVRKAGVIAWDGTHYRPLPIEADGRKKVAPD